MYSIRNIALAENKRKVLNFTIGEELVDEIVVESHSFWVNSPTYFALWRQKYIIQCYHMSHLQYDKYELSFFSVVIIVSVMGPN